MPSGWLLLLFGSVLLSRWTERHHRREHRKTRMPYIAVAASYHALHIYIYIHVCGCISFAQPGLDGVSSLSPIIIILCPLSPRRFLPLFNKRRQAGQRAARRFLRRRPFGGDISVSVGDLCVVGLCSTRRFRVWIDGQIGCGGYGHYCAGFVSLVIAFFLWGIILFASTHTYTHTYIYI